MAQLKGLVRLVRPRQWIKNGFVLAPLVFAGEFVKPQAVGQAMVATLLFCLASAAVYVLNDLHDMARDRLHPRKATTRPLVTGDVTVQQARGLLAFLYALVFAAAFVLPKLMIVVLGYVALNMAYTFMLKRQPVVDIFTIAIGFVLRVYAGAVALSVPVSGWMFVTTLCLALYLAAIKRRQELAQNGAQGREVLKKYSVALMDRYAEMSATGALVFYSMFVMSARPQLIITVPVVLFGLFRYWYVVEENEAGESPTDVLFADWQLWLTIVVWLGCWLFVLWPQAV